jgi:hypothetical protein
MDTSEKPVLIARRVLTRCMVLLSRIYELSRTGYLELDRTVQLGQDDKRRNHGRTAITGQTEHNSRGMAAGTGQPGPDSLGRTAKTGQPGPGRERGWQGHDSKEKKLAQDN